MNFLKFVILGTAFSILSSSQGEDVVYDHERLKTTDGKTYHEISVIGSDTMGLTFRHREGIAKVDFTALSEAFRMLYEGVEDLPEGVAETAKEADPVQLNGIAPFGDRPTTLVARNRLFVEFPYSFWQIGGGINHDRRVPAWPGWWPDHERIHRLTHPLYRELAVRDFLLSSGLLPYPYRR